ncbi:unnamed protein product [Polarella glacialis]|uniref:ribonuclease H n=1 Tax=Polarella glacialis TaxID=89957 RepID=A0A813L3E6_POLGL|nr:unnamed protein product [Polarella glacialis]CAE8714475.1 unnamed protein product [Polarella glacialis]
MLSASTGHGLGEPWNKIGSMTPLNRSVLEQILAGALRTQHRLYAAGMSGTPACPLCGCDREDLLHVFKCPETEHLRTRKPADPLFDLTWQQTGIVQNDPRIDEEIMKLALTKDESIAAILQPLAERVDVWTDGASEDNAVERFRRAGVGVFFGHAHRLNVSAILPGIYQTNQLAELFAIVLALKVSGVPLWLRTDSEWVVGIWATILINGGTQNTSFEHDDLWVELWELYQRQPNARDGLPWIIVTKIKGHATQDDICSGIISALDAEGNRHADKFATDGAKKHSVPGHIRRRYAKIVRHTLWWQTEAILTILERNAKLKEAGLWNASHPASIFLMSLTLHSQNCHNRMVRFRKSFQVSAGDSQELEQHMWCTMMQISSCLRLTGHTSMFCTMLSSSISITFDGL